MNHPANELVASFVGIETVFPGVVQKASGGSFVVDVAGRKIEGIGEVTVGETVLCCIRPENVIVSRQEAGTETETSARNNLPAIIVKIIPQGPFFKLQLDGGFFLTAYVMPQSLENLALQEGKSVNLSFKATAVHAIRRGK
jgi:tungstate transport system ATP-binding protein